MSYQTINTRTIIVPELSSVFRVESIELPEDFADLLPQLKSGEIDEQSKGAIDDTLELLCQKIFSLTPTNILTFSRWRETTETVSETFRLPSFLDEVEKRLPNKKADRSSMEKWLQENRLKMATLEQQFGTVESFVSAFLKNGLLAPLPWRRISADAFGLQKFTDDPRILEAVYWQFRTQELWELDLLRWHEVSQILSSSTFPSADLAEKELNSYQLPMAASPTLKPISLEQFKKFCYGTAALAVGSSGIGSMGGLQQGNPHVLACVVGGAITALVFVSTASLAQYIENYLNGKAAKARPKRKVRRSSDKGAKAA